MFLEYSFRRIWQRGTEGKIAAINYARKNDIPFLGIYFGMQMAVIEFARNKLNIKNATSSEFGPSKASVVGLMSEWTKDKLMKGTDKDSRRDNAFGEL